MRILTRADFDGVACVFLLRQVFGADTPVAWTEPNAMDRGKVEVRSGDILANLPFDPRCSFWFDHHPTNKGEHEFEGRFRTAPSAARVIYEYYEDRLSGFSELVAYADKIDTADFSAEEISAPEKHPYIILSMILPDEPPDTLINGLGAAGIDALLRQDDMQNKIAQFTAQSEVLKAFLLSHVQVSKGVALLDTRGQEDTPLGNKFLVYSLFPHVYVSVKVRADKWNEGNDVISIGHSIVNRTCNVHAGLLVSQYSGGGHRGAGSCSFESHKTDAYLEEILDILSRNESRE
jgi:oligoribonuclease NrnB/cAMP/cGMP phosphodiesterase (DHH superfamily)